MKDGTCFAGHGIRGEELVSKMVFLVTKTREWRRDRPTLTYIDILKKDTGLDPGSIKTAMQNHEVLMWETNKQASKQANKQANKHACMQASKQASVKCCWFLIYFCIILHFFRRVVSVYDTPLYLNSIFVVWLFVEWFLHACMVGPWLCVCVSAGELQGSNREFPCKGLASILEV